MKKYASIFPILQSAKLLSVTPGGYYSWLKRKKSKTKLKHEILTKEIQRIFFESNEEYGSPRITAQLIKEGFETNKRVVATIMRKERLLAKGFKARNRDYENKKSIEEYVKDNFEENLNKNINKIWITDIIHVKCSDGKLYLSAYIDLATKIPKCFSISNTMTKDIVLTPLKNYKGKLPQIIHSDCGSQYRSTSFKLFCDIKEINHSMIAPGTPIDNSVVGAFHRSLKKNLITPNKDKSREVMKNLIKEYLSKN